MVLYIIYKRSQLENGSSGFYGCCMCEDVTEANEVWMYEVLSYNEDGMMVYSFGQL